MKLVAYLGVPVALSLGGRSRICHSGASKLGTESGNRKIIIFWTWVKAIYVDKEDRMCAIQPFYLDIIKHAFSLHNMSQLDARNTGCL